MDISLNLVCCLIFVENVLGNIIDTSFPIVIHQNAGKAGESSDHNYFGYSLAFMKGYQSDSPFTVQQDNRSTIFIGAPNETEFTSKSGVVWKCEFNRNEYPPVRCSVLERIANVFSTSNRIRCPNNKYSETEQQQWIGANLNIHPTSRELLACAPRWKINDYSNMCTGHEKIPGACYLASNINTVLLNPLDRKQVHYPEWVIDQWLKFPLYRFAEFGFSSHFTDSGQLIVGAPGTKRGTGAMIEVKQLGQHSDSLTVNNDFSYIRAGSLHGYSVVSGRTSSGGEYLASGAPRARRLYGAVTITYPSNRIVSPILEGEQFGSYFGYALATLDLDRDNYDELLVGAPFYAPQLQSGQSMTGYNTGCIFIFNLAQLERTTRPTKLCVDPHRISVGSRFGSAITKIGDINFDFYEDFAISAPYDDNGQGTIFIYHGGRSVSSQPAQVIRGKSLNIENLRGFGTYLLGGRQVDIDGNATPDLVVGAFESRHVVILRTRPVARVFFRISFHTLENNQGQIMRFSPTASESYLIVRTCIRLRFFKRVPSELALDTWLSFEVKSTSIQVQFEGTVDEQRYNISARPWTWTCLHKRLVLSPQESDSSSNSSTIEVRARLKYNETEASQTQVIQHANVKLSSSSTSKTQQSWNEYTQAYKNFNAYLPVPIPPIYSEWGQLSIAKDNCDDDGDPQCNAKLKLQVKLFIEVNATTQERRRLKQGRNLTIGNFDSLVVQIEMSNDKDAESAYNPELRITVGVSKAFNMEPSSLDTIWELSGKLGKCRDLDDTKDEIENTKNNEMQGITTKLFGQRCAQVVHKGGKIEYRVKIRNWGHLRVGNSVNTGFLSLKVEAFPQQNRNQSVYDERIRVPLKADINVNVKSSVPQDQIEIDPGLARSGLVDLSQFYLITNNGSSGTTMEAVTAEILIPTHANLKGENLTKVIGVTDPSSLNIRCTSDNAKFFVLPSKAMEMEGQQNNDTVNDSGIRSKRSIKPTDVSPEKVSVKKSNDFIMLSGCEGDTQKSGCQKIVCKMDLLPRATEPREIKLQMYILENVLGELVTLETKGIRVKSVISVYFQGVKVINEHTGVTQRNFSTVKGIHALYLLGAGAGGSLLLILIVFVLFKCGFFRRKTKEDLKQLKRQTMLMDQNSLKLAQEGLQALMESERHEEVAL